MIPGEDPCPILKDHAGIWRFDAEKIGQTQKDGELYASGLRSIVALEWNKEDKHLYSVVHGRDDLTRLWPNKINKWNSALLPSEEFVRIEKAIILDGHIAIMIKFKVKKFLLQNMVEMEILLVVVTNIKTQLLDSLDIGHLMT